MNNTVEWIAAEAEIDPPKSLLGRALRAPRTRRANNEVRSPIRPESLPAHTFQSWVASKGEWQKDDPLDRNPYIGRYRNGPWPCCGAMYVWRWKLEGCHQWWEKSSFGLR